MKSHNTKCSIVFSLAVFCLFLLAGCAQVDPVQKAKELLTSENITEVVQLYNDYIEKADEQQKEEIENLIAEHISALLIDWDVSDDTYDAVYKELSELSNISNDKLSSSATEGLNYITREHDGNRLLFEGEECYKENNYLEAMTYLSKADPEYSQYALFEVLYTDSKLILLQEVGHPTTISEYENAIITLKGYLDVVNDDDFQRALTVFEEELAEYRDIYEILTTATDLYENGKYKESFDKLETGIKKYPDNKKIEYALSSYQYAYVLTVCSDVIDLIDSEQYDTAETTINIAIENYDCEEFRELSNAIRMKTDIMFAFRTRFSQAGDYVFRSTKKMVLGDFDEEEQETLLSLGGSVAASLLNVDAPLDVRDLAYDISHWGEGDYFAARLALDAVGVLPLIGAIKYIKHLDTAADIIKGVDKTADALDTAHDLAKAADTAADVAKGADKLFDTADVISDIRKKTDTVADLADNFSDFARKTDIIDDITDTIKKADNIDDLADAAKKADSVGDAAETVVRHYDPIKTINQALEGKTHQVTGIEFIRKNLDLSDGRHITGVFPQFDSFYDVNLPDEYIKASFDTQKKYLTDFLQETAKTPDGLKYLQEVFNADQIDDILNGIIPEGFTWHHNETEGLMQLVEEVIHDATGHTGGMSIWGIGY